MTDIATLLQQELVTWLTLTASEAQRIVSSLYNQERARLWAGLQNFQEGRILSTLFFLEFLVARNKRNKSERIQELFVAHADKREKLDLISAFLFSKACEFQSMIPSIRHVFFEGVGLDQEWLNSNFITDLSINCSLSAVPICRCMEWLQDHAADEEKLSGYLREVIHHLYEMRSAVVHESFPVLFFADVGPHAGSYPLTRKKSFRYYESFMQPKPFFEISKNVAKKYLLSQCG